MSSTAWANASVVIVLCMTAYFTVKLFHTDAEHYVGGFLDWLESQDK